MKQFLFAPELRMGFCGLVLLALLAGNGCRNDAPLVLPDSSRYFPPELRDLHLGMEKIEVDKYFAAQSTQLTDRGLETASQFIRDSVRIGVAFAYRDGRLATATIWYDYALVPERVDRERQVFMRSLIDSNGLDFEPCSFTMDQGKFAPDLGLIWKQPGCFAVTTFSKPSYAFPDTMSFRPYYQFSLFDTTITPWHLWRNMIIPAVESERPYFREIDSLRQAVQQQGMH
jgi:hypothetical protein